MTGTIEVYSFEDADGNEFGSFTTQDKETAKSYARQGHLRVIANTFEWSDSEPVVEWDYTNREMPEVPDDFPVKVLTPDQMADAKDPATCGTCGRSWDDAVGTTWTPAPAARCPFEYFH